MLFRSQEILKEAFIHPLRIEGELYVGIPPGTSNSFLYLLDSLSRKATYTLLTGPSCLHSN